MDKKYKGLSLRTITRIMIIITSVIAICLLVFAFLIINKYREYQKSSEEFVALESSANNLEQASDYLTEQGRYFVVTGEDRYYHAYFEEVFTTKRREIALETINNNISDEETKQKLATALNESNKLMDTEYYAFRLVIDSINGDISKYPEVKDVVIDAADSALSNDAKRAKAINLMLNQNYNDAKDRIEQNVNGCIESIIKLSNEQLKKSNRSFVVFVTVQQILFFLLVMIVVADFLVAYYKLILPLENGAKLIQEGKNLKVEGAKEYQILSEIYNETKERDEKSKDILTYEVEHDKLTGLYNRHGYDTLYHRLNLENTAYVLVDIDNFKKINDRYGHAVGDRVLKKVGNVLKKYFRSEDYLCRIGGDEFAILLGDCNSDIANQLKEKGERINLVLQSKEGGVPPITLSIGVAFGDEHDDTDSLFRKADTALYQTKSNGRNGITIFNEDVVEENE